MTNLRKITFFYSEITLLRCTKKWIMPIRQFKDFRYSAVLGPTGFLSRDYFEK